jgi:hypothetical protein
MIPTAKCRQSLQLPAIMVEQWIVGSRQAPQLAATWIVGAITERLASRVKGLTGDFCVLLLARKPRRCRQIRHCALRLRQKVFGANA